MKTLRKLKVAGLSVKQLIEAPLYNIFDAEHIPLLHYCIRNWGDAINPFLVNLMSGKNIRSVDIDAYKASQKIFPSMESDIYMAIGSILHHADSRVIVWGSGLISQNVLPVEPPKYITAVRGPKTARALRNAGIECPDVFGDPVLLLPKYIKNNASKKYKLGVVLHNTDERAILPDEILGIDDVIMISLRGGILDTLEKILACDAIVSSSLHGLIVADAYGIPSGRIYTSDTRTGDFKFEDYYESIGQPNPKKYKLEKDTTLRDILSLCKPREVALDLNKLADAAPF